MQNIFKNKFFALAVVATFLVPCIMTVAQIPSAKSKMQDIPVAIVNEDKGELGKNVTTQILNNKTKAEHADRPMFKWHLYNSETSANKDLDFNGNYATVVIPKDFSSKIVNINNDGAQANIKIIVNQARNNALSASISQILTGMVNKISSTIGSTMLTKLGEAPLPANKVAVIANPITAEVSKTHATTNLESATSVFFQPIWLTSVATTMLIYLGTKSFKPRNKKEVIWHKTLTMAVIATLSIASGFITRWYASQFLGYHFDDSVTLSLFLALSSFAFIMLFSGFIAWLGVGGIAIFVLLLFFGLPLLVMAPEMLPTFYQDWILPWLPMRFLYEGIRELLYYNGNLLNQNSLSLVVIACLGSVLFFLESFSNRHKQSFK